MADPNRKMSMAHFFKGIKDEPRSESFRDTLKDLAESSSLHGIPKIVSSRQIAVKVLWCLLFLGTASVLTYQLVTLFRTYYSYPIQTSVSLQFSAIPFPAISICNMNPVRKSKLSESEELGSLFNQIPNRRRKRREAREPSSDEDRKYSRSSNTNDQKQEVHKDELNEKDKYVLSGHILQDIENIPNDDKTTENIKTETGPGIFKDTIRPTHVTKDVDELHKHGQNTIKNVRRRERAAVSSSSSSSDTGTSDNSSSSSDSGGSPSSSDSGGSPSSSDSGDSPSSSDSGGSPSSSDSGGSPSSSDSDGSSSSSDSGSSYYSESSSYSGSSSYHESSSNDYWYSWYSWWNSYQYDYDYYSYGGTGSGWDYWDNLYAFSSSKKDIWEQRVEDVKSVFRNTSLSLRHDMGHQKEDLFAYATFAGQIQNVSFLRNFSSNDYGNCYTFSAPKYIAWRTGPSHGFKLTLNLEIDEYISNFTTGYGLRLVFHEPGTHPLPSQDGITLSPSTETNIGLKTVKISRLGQPHGNCESGASFAKRFKLKYSLSACNEFCRIKATVDVCSCLLPDAPDGIDFNTTFVPVCNSSSKSTNHKCVFDLNSDFNQGVYECDCREPCNEYIYTKTMSSTYWPTDDYLPISWALQQIESDLLLLRVHDGKNRANTKLGILLDEICSTKNQTALWKDVCANLDNMAYYDFDKYRNNFVRVLIYFEDLNYEKITEEPLYEGVRFLSDIGGAMGLFMGASVLSIVEVAQLVLEIILYARNRLSNKHKTNVTPIKSTN